MTVNTRISVTLLALAAGGYSGTGDVDLDTCRTGGTGSPPVTFAGAEDAIPAVELLDAQGAMREDSARLWLTQSNGDDAQVLAFDETQ